MEATSSSSSKLSPPARDVRAGGREGVCGWAGERKRGNRIKQQQKPSQQQKPRKAEGETPSSGLKERRGEERKNTKTMGKEEEGEGEEAKLVCLLFLLRRLRTQSLRDPEEGKGKRRGGKGGARKTEERKKGGNRKEEGK